MSRYRQQLPQLSGDLFITDGGIETTLIFGKHMTLPDFAAFHLLASEVGLAALDEYFRTYAALARRYGVGCILESPTWRANADWGARLGYSAAALTAANREAMALLERVRAEYECPTSPMVMSGCVGPRGDGYNPAVLMSADEAQAYHAPQVSAFRDAQADLITAMTMTYPAEALGVARASLAAGMPVVIAFTVETDGRLPTGETLPEAIEQVDEATADGPSYYMINCAHPTHFAGALETGSPWTNRIRGLRSNASTKSHAELNEAAELDDGDPADFGARHAELRRRLSHLNVLGGCCGTDERHVEEICKACWER